jgi:pilus assembly protein FimV
LSDDQKPVEEDMDEQLDSLFAETEGGEDGKDDDPLSDPLRELKAIFLAVDWEINDDIMSALLGQIEKLKKQYAQDRVLLLFLGLLGAVGKYIKAQKANAHPDAVKLLNSIYRSLEIVSMSEAMTESERKRILRTEVRRFQALKEELARKKTTPEAAPGKQKKAADDPSACVPPALGYVLEEIRKTIRSEFAALREELKS